MTAYFPEDRFRVSIATIRAALSVIRCLLKAMFGARVFLFLLLANKFCNVVVESKLLRRSEQLEPMHD